MSKTSFRGNSEDCLSMNIFLPKTALEENSEPKAVLLNFHGGAFTTGTNDDYRLQGEYLAHEQDVIVIQVYTICNQYY